MRVLDDIVVRLGSARVAGETASGAQAAEVLAAGEELVHIADVAGVEDEGVSRAVEDAMQRDRQFDDAEIRPQVSPRAGDLADEEGPDLVGQLDQLIS